MSNQEELDQKRGGCQRCGQLFIDFFNGPEEAAKHIPEVDVKFKVRRLSDFNSRNGSFYVDCLLMLDWEDPSLANAKNKDNPDFVSATSPIRPFLTCFPLHLTYHFSIMFCACSVTMCKCILLLHPEAKP